MSEFDIGDKVVHVTSAEPVMQYIRDDENGKAVCKWHTPSGSKEEAFNKVELQKAPPPKAAAAAFVV